MRAVARRPVGLRGVATLSGESGAFVRALPDREAWQAVVA